MIFPPHAFALHRHQSAKMFAWLHSRSWSSASATTLITMGLLIGWHPAAEAKSTGSDQRDIHPVAETHSASLVGSITTAPEVDIQADSLTDSLTDSQTDGQADNQVDSQTHIQPLLINNSAQLPDSSEYEGKPINLLVFEPVADIKVDRLGTTTLPELDQLLSTQLASRSSLNQSSLHDPAVVSEASPAEVTPAEVAPIPPDSTSTEPLRSSDLSYVSHSSSDLGKLLVHVQGVYTLQGEESSGRGRLSASYAITPNVLVGGTVDVTGGEAFADSPQTGIDLNELYVAVSPSELPNLRFIAGMLDLTSYFDRNSFAKDAATQFLNPVFQTNPALAAAGLGSRPAILMNWSIVDPLELKVAGFSSNRNLDEFALNGFVGELGLRLDNFILRGTYIVDQDSGNNDGFQEVYGFPRDSGFGLDSDDWEAGYGLNAEYFIPEINLGLFARYGWYQNLDLDQGGSTYSLGFNLLDLFMPDDRLGLAYGQNLSNGDLREEQDEDYYPDVWEFFYDFRITPNLRAGVTVQASNQFSDTIAGFRIRADFDSSDFGRLFR